MIDAEQVRNLRKWKGITQINLGIAVGLSQGAISGFERGKFNLSPEKLERIQEALGIPNSDTLVPNSHF